MRNAPRHDRVGAVATATVELRTDVTQARAGARADVVQRPVAYFEKTFGRHPGELLAILVTQMTPSRSFSQSRFAGLGREGLYSSMRRMKAT